ncbi:MAG: hypothetical protein QW197_02435 [Candidatus Aenigmatarchaeota archaeon]
MDIEKIASYLPSIERFKVGLSFKEKLKWVLILLALYYFLYEIPLAGTYVNLSSQLALTQLYSILTGAKIGSLATLGVAPIITASIIVHVLVASKILNWDIKEIEGRRKANALEKILSYVFIFIEGFVFTYAATNLISIKPGYEWLAYIQIVIGGILVYLIAKSIDKLQFGSGLSLIIFAGIIYSFVTNLFSPFTITINGKIDFWFKEENAYPVGKVISMFVALERNDYQIFLASLIQVISTFLLILFVLYILRSNVEIPLIYTQFRGFGRPLELSLLYTSTLALIFASALLTNLHLMFLSSATQIKGDLRCGIFGCFDQNNNAVSGIAYYLSPPKALLLEIFGVRALPQGVTLEKEIIKTIIFFFLFSAILILFAWIWVYTAGMDPKSIAESLAAYGFGISGYRSDERIIEDVLNKYIPYLTIFSGIISAIIAILADVTGSILYSTALIIFVSVSYTYYTLLKREKSEDIPDFFKKFLE